MIRGLYRAVIKPVVRTVTPSRVWSLYGDALWLWGFALPRERLIASVLGWPATLSLRLWRLAVFRGGRVRKLRVVGFPHPLYFRPGTSDPDALRQVFGVREYQCAIGNPNVEYILDCGANVGFTTLYLLHHYPNARAVVVEPDPDNMRLCHKNLARFADRITFVQSGVWSASVPLVLSRASFRDGREWSIQVRVAAAGERADLIALTVSDLLARGSFPRADILKIDIEAAEAEVFAGPTEWLDRTRMLVIELHGPECARVVAQAVAGRLEYADTSGELTVYKRK